MEEEGRRRGRPLIVTMSFDRLILSGLLASRARLRFTGWQPWCGEEESFVNRERKKRPVLSLDILLEERSPR